MIIHLKKFFSEEELAKIWDIILSVTHWRSSGHQQHVSHEDNLRFREFMYTVFQDGNKATYLSSIVSKRFPDYPVNDFKEPGLALLRQPEGQQLGLHYDAESSNMFGKRFLTFLCYYNDDYDGGNFFYIDTDKSEIDVEISRGDVIILESTLVHGSRLVENGDKYLSVWYTGL